MTHRRATGQPWKIRFISSYSDAVTGRNEMGRNGCRKSNFRREQKKKVKLMVLARVSVTSDLKLGDNSIIFSLRRRFAPLLLLSVPRASRACNQKRIKREREEWNGAASVGDVLNKLSRRETAFRIGRDGPPTITRISSDENQIRMTVYVYSCFFSLYKTDVSFHRIGLSNFRLPVIAILLPRRFVVVRR